MAQGYPREGPIVATIDEEIAVKAFGYKEWSQPPDAEGNFGGIPILVPPGGVPKDFALPPKGKIGYGYFVHIYSESLESAMSLVNIMNLAGAEVIFGCFPNSPFNIELRRWRDRREEDIPGDPHTGRSRETFACLNGTSLPELICRAFLRFHRVTSSERDRHPE